LPIRNEHSLTIGAWVSALPFPLFAFFGRILSLMLTVCFWVELLVEVESLCDIADVLADIVHAPVGRREECLLSARALIRAAIERGVRQGVTVALTIA
jgi:hypothetical protein